MLNPVNQPRTDQIHRQKAQQDIQIQGHWKSVEHSHPVLGDVFTGFYEHICKRKVDKNGGTCEEKIWAGMPHLAVREMKQGDTAFKDPKEYKPSYREERPLPRFHLFEEFNKLFHVFASRCASLSLFPFLMMD
jgi:hypothetical protein